MIRFEHTTITSPWMPRYMADYGMGVLLLSFMGVLFVSGSHIMDWYWWLIGGIYIAIFVYGSQSLSRQWSRLSEKRFSQNLYWGAFAFRAITVIWTFGFYYLMRGDFFDFVGADSQYYHSMAVLGADSIWNGDWNLWRVYDADLKGGLDLSDSGYILFLGPIYALVGKSILLSRIVQCFFGAGTCLFLYRLTQRHFDEPTARLAAILCMLFPSMAMYCGITLKETMMAFLVTWFVERADAVLMNHTMDWRSIIRTSLIGLSLFAFRTVLGAVLFLAFVTALIFSSSRIMKSGKRIALIVLALGFLAVMFTGQIQTEVEKVLNSDIQGQQRVSLEKRYGDRSDGTGNSLAKYASAAVFAPLIFTIPFPTMVDVADQDNQRMFMSGCFAKNLISGLVILSLFMLLFSGDWRRHVLPLAVLIGYLVVLVFSQFAHSERFHQPILPLECMLAAFGIIHFPRGKRSWWMLWCATCVLFCIGWAWFKLKGRGLI